MHDEDFYLFVDIINNTIVMICLQIFCSHAQNLQICVN